jgi:stage V sporulation protein AA
MKTEIIGRKKVCLKDIAEITTHPDIQQKIENICVFTVPHNEKHYYRIGIIDMIEAITRCHEQVTVQNVGEMEALIQYLPEAPKVSKPLEALKIFLISLIIFSGTTVAVMAYQTDVSLSKTFTTLNKVFTGRTEENPLYITIPYSVGLPVGVILFFNHLGKKKLTDDPTPIEVEVEKYETDVQTQVIETLIEKKRGE